MMEEQLPFFRMKDTKTNRMPVIAILIVEILLPLYLDKNKRERSTNQMESTMTNLPAFNRLQWKLKFLIYQVLADKDEYSSLVTGDHQWPSQQAGRLHYLCGGVFEIIG
jgi:hypothetical protein